MRIHWTTDVQGRHVSEIETMARSALAEFNDIDAYEYQHLHVEVSPDIVQTNGAGDVTIVSYGGTARAILTIGEE